MSHRTFLFLLPAVRLLAGFFTAAALAQTAASGVPAMPDDVKPIRVAGLGIRVSDLERSKKFYTEVLGLKVCAKVPAQGEPVEYLLGMTGDIRADTLIVIRKSEIKPGATEFGSIIVVVPNARNRGPQHARVFVLRVVGWKDGRARGSGGLSPCPHRRQNQLRERSRRVHH